MEFQCDNCTGHAFSRSGVDGWTWTGVAATADVQYVDGTAESFGHCERPHVLFDRNGTAPVALTNGVKVVGESNDDLSWTLLRPLQTG